MIKSLGEKVTIAIGPSDPRPEFKLVFIPIGEGFKQVLGFRFDLHPRTLVIEESTLNGEVPNQTPNPNPKVVTSPKIDTSDEDLMFFGLSPLHVACVFDQVSRATTKLFPLKIYQELRLKGPRFL